MNKKTLTLATAFVFAHFAFVAPFVPLKNILPAGFGALSMTSMTLVLLLVGRWRIVDRILGGSDKAYASHRWLGFFCDRRQSGALGIGLAGRTGHFAGVGRTRQHRRSNCDHWTECCDTCGHVAGDPVSHLESKPYVDGALIPLVGFSYLFCSQPFGRGRCPWALMAGVSIVGVFAWCQTLLRKLVPERLVEVERVIPFDGGVDVTFRSKKPMPKFQHGQFAMLSHKSLRAEAHPFTIAGGDEMTRRFVIRAAGDWTDNFVSAVKIGDHFRIGRAVGRFLPQIDSQRKEQFWVAGGVVITPFLSAFERMQPDVGGRVTLIFGILSREAAGAIRDVERHARRLPQLNLIVLSDDRNERLTLPRLLQIIRDMSEDTQVYLCGPQGLKNMIGRAWAMANISGRIYSEHFDFRGAYGMEHLNYIFRPVLDAVRNIKLMLTGSVVASS